MTKEMELRSTAESPAIALIICQPVKTIACTAIHVAKTYVKRFMTGVLNYLRGMVSSSQIRCSSCDEWNVVESKADTCKSCGRSLIKPNSAAEIASIKRRTEPIEFKIPILPEDGFFIRIGKHIFNVVQMVFLAVLSFFMWLIAAGPG